MHQRALFYAVCVNAPNRFGLVLLWCRELQWCHIRSRLVWVSKGCMFHWCIDCGKFYCLICQGWKLLGWTS